ncbi:MAG: ChrR family anti-sigma-E factor [Alphaproteobacteria bacterium]
MPRFHPTDEHLLDYVTGAQEESLALLIASHLSLCPECRARAAALEALGGSLLQEAEAQPLRPTALNDCLERISAAGEAVVPPSPPPVHDPLVPAPLRTYLGRPLAELPWRGIGPVREFRVPVPTPGHTVKLLRIAPGASLPEHRHGGEELTLVLAGGFSDGVASFARGDVACADSSVVHTPVADDDGECICLAVTTGPVRFTGFVGRLLNLVVRY